MRVYASYTHNEEIKIKSIRCVYGAYTQINAYTQHIRSKKQIEEIKIKSIRCVYGAYTQINAYTQRIRNKKQIEKIKDKEYTVCIRCVYADKFVYAAYTQ
jgi:effector-binding domain-containing protein